MEVHRVCDGRRKFERWIAWAEFDSAIARVSAGKDKHSRECRANVAFGAAAGSIYAVSADGVREFDGGGGWVV